MLDDGLFPLSLPGQAVGLVLPVLHGPGLLPLHLHHLVGEDEPGVVLQLALHLVTVGQHHGQGQAVHQPHRPLAEVEPQVGHDVEAPPEDSLPLQSKGVVTVIVFSRTLSYQDTHLSRAQLVHHSVQQAVLHVLQLLRSILHLAPQLLSLGYGDLDSQRLDVVENVAELTYFVFQGVSGYTLMFCHLVTERQKYPLQRTVSLSAFSLLMISVGKISAGKLGKFSSSS